MKKAFYLDLLERSVWTFVQAFAAFWITDGVLDLGMALDELAIAAAVAGGLAVAKGLASTRLPWSDSNDASTLPSGAGE